MITDAVNCIHYNIMDAVRICVTKEKKIKRQDRKIYLQYYKNGNSIIYYPYERREGTGWRYLFDYPRFSQEDMLSYDWIVLDDDDENAQW